MVLLFLLASFIACALSGCGAGSSPTPVAPGETASPATPTPPPPPPSPAATAEPRATRPSERRCGDGVCDGPENIENCPRDCGEATSSPSVRAEGDTLPLFVTIYYHVEPNKQLFERVEPGYFEAVSECIRGMSSDLASIDVHATFCFAWLYNDLVYCRNHDLQTGKVVNSALDTGIETYQHVLASGHEIAYHSHPAVALAHGGEFYYARPNATCDDFSPERHRWSGTSAEESLNFYPGVYQFDDPADPWYAEFTWERTGESLYLIADYLAATVRHTNGGQRPLLDITNKYGSGINHEENLAQVLSLMEVGFDLLSPEVMPFFHTDYAPEGPEWTDFSTAYVAYFGPENNIQLYYPDIDGGHLDRSANNNQGLTFMPVQRAGQLGWIGTPDDDYYDPRPLGTGYGGIRWKDENFYEGHSVEQTTPWSDTPVVVTFPSMAQQFNNAMQRHMTETPGSVNAWGFDFHIVNVMWADFSGLSDNWDKAVFFMRDMADGVADGTADEPRPDLVQFVTMQELSATYDMTTQSATR